MDTISEKTTIIYNKMNLSAVLSTAILISEFPDAVVADVSQLIADDVDRFIWVGVDPKNNISEFFHRTKNKEHIIINEGERLTSVMEILNPFMRKEAIEPGEDHGDALNIKSTLIGITCKHFGFENDDYNKLDFHTARFYERSTEVEFLAFVYSNLIEANRAIMKRTAFTVKTTNQKDIDRYMKDIRDVKMHFTKFYQQATFVDGDKIRNAVHTSISDFSFHLALRLTRLVHRNFLNMTMGMSGAIVYTNMRDIRFDKTIGKPLVLN